MPELPEVETIKTAIAQRIGSVRIENVAIYNRKLREYIPEDIEAKITGASIIDYKRMAKYIVMFLDNDLCLLWHMGMSGKIKLSNEIPEREKHDHIVIQTSNGIITYNDPRRFGLFTYCNTNNLMKHRLLSHVGVEPFSKDLTAEYLYKHLQKRKNAIKPTLLDQKIVVGIGNIYASEILYESGISPLRAANRISLKECSVLVDNIKKVLQKAIDAGGSTLRDYKKPDGDLGYFQNMHCVYNKTGQRCPLCTCNIEKTGGIKKLVQAGRSTFYCERLQK